jgi:hypothetical protein
MALVKPAAAGEEAAPPEPPDFKKRYNQAPTEKARVVRIKAGRRRV